MYQCKCGKSFEKRQSYVAHCGHCKTHLGYTPKDKFGDSRAWCRGLTKETDSRVARIARAQSLSRAGKPGTPHTDEFKSKISEIARYNARNHLNGWKSGDNRVPNKYELLASEFLDRYEIPFSREVVLRKRDLDPTLRGSYELDFVIYDKVNLEIDGSSHSKSHDDERDSLVSSRYQVYRIKTEDSLEVLDRELQKFLVYLSEYLINH